MTSDELAGKTLSGAGWTALSVAGQRGLSLLSTMVLARLLAPSAYGLLGMAMVFVAVANTLRDLGTSSALVQRRQFSAEVASTVFWINVTVGLAGALLLGALAPLVAAMYREPRVVPVLAVLSLSLFFGNLGAVHHATLLRAMAFRRIALIQVTAALASTCCAIALALGGAGVFSLVGAVIVDSVASAAMFWMMAPWRPVWRLRRADLRQVSSYGTHLIGARLLLYVSRHADKALVGRYLGAIPLGYYALAHGLMMYPLHNGAWALAQVLFPAFSRIQDDGERFGQAYLRTVAVIATLCFPLMLGMLVTADLLVRVCFGDAWLPMVPILRILAPAGMIQSASTTAGIVFTSKGRTDWLFRLVVAETTLALTAYVVGLPWGLLGVATASALTHFLWSFPLFTFAARLSGVPVSAVYRALWPPLRDAALMAAAVVAVRAALVDAGVATPWVLLGAMVGVGVVLYAALVLRGLPPTALGRLAWARRLAALSRG